MLQAQEDSFLWLEEVEAQNALDWVSQQNQETFSVFEKEAIFQTVFDESLSIYNADDRIIAPNFRGDYFYNFIQDKRHVRGVWRRAAKEAYGRDSIDWEILIDLDKLSEEENEKWVFKGATALYPDYNKCLIFLSPGGTDATVVREFDVQSKSFLADGFQLPISKGSASWMDKDHLLLSRDFGPNTLTASGYPREVRIWKRGTDVSTAQLVYQIPSDYMSVSANKDLKKKVARTYIYAYKNFYEKETLLLNTDGSTTKLSVPKDATVYEATEGQAIILLKSDWKIHGKVYQQGAVLTIDLEDLVAGKYILQELFVPKAKMSLSGLETSKSRIVLTILNNIVSELYVYEFKEGAWLSQKIAAPSMGTISTMVPDDDYDTFYFYYTNFLERSKLYKADALSLQYELVKGLDNHFDTENMVVEQKEVASKDGTLIPYFVVRNKATVYDGKNPTLLYAYGGFEVSLEPSYSGVNGTAWLEKGGVYVLANIRGGGEFGPKWHQAGLKENRQKVYDDFHAVAQDLIDTKITSSEHLGIRGGSNGGLLMGVAFTQRPDLYRAVVCQVPLLDMKRYNKLLAGASWMGEYGNPDIAEEWAYIKKYSPYQNLKVGQKYPEVLFTTSTKDDRVHPGHARKMVAKMQDMGYKVYYYENMEGGHGGASTNDQYARSAALVYSYLWSKLN
jgi:prolyl oligopeptidase